MLCASSQSSHRSNVTGTAVRVKCPLTGQNELVARWPFHIFFMSRRIFLWPGDARAHASSKGKVLARGATERSPCPPAPAWFKAFQGPQKAYKDDARRRRKLLHLKGMEKGLRCALLGDCLPRRLRRNEKLPRGPRTGESG